MQIVFTKLSDDRHSVSVARPDGTTERIALESRSFLCHDLAHFAIELEVPIRGGYWGCVASGVSLSGEGVAGTEVMFAETLAGSIQTLMRTEADLKAYSELLRDVSPASAQPDLPTRVYELVRQLRGHWKGTPYGGEMNLEWPDRQLEANYPRSTVRPSS